MEYTLTISQKAIAENFPELDIKDAALIDFLGRFVHGGNVKKRFIGEVVFYWFDYGKIMAENPLLKLGEEAIRKRMRVLCQCKILKSHPENSGGLTFFAFGEEFQWTHKHRENNPDPSVRKSRPPRYENPDISNIPLDQKNQDQNNQETTPKKKSKPLKEKKEKEKKDVPPPLDFSRFDNPEAVKALFARWLKYRVEIKKPYKSEDTLRSSVKLLFQYSNGISKIAEQVIENSIGNGYQGFFEPKPIRINTAPAQSQPANELTGIIFRK